ncbi:MAG TPA: serine/threonine-protein kinase [Gammaproteobacteria bacterium]|nr:serine/threonine-protein kinase [Gammaproteobacteria bacterium]
MDTLVRNQQVEAALPERIGKYEVTRELGVGSTSRVYLCHDPYLGKDVALKLYPAAEDLPEGRARTHRRVFFNEAHLVGRLQHPSIVPIYDAGEDNGRYYVVMEYVRNADPLTVFAKPERALPIHGVADMIFKCAKALDFAHRRGVVHRDIKPSNILLTKTGGVRIIDFGIAQTANSALKGKRGLIGSPSYMAPEQIREQEPEVTPQSDLFSLGVVMYELLAGRRPFDGANLDELRRRIAWSTPVPLHRLRRDVPAVLERIVFRALNKDPAKRYQTGLEFAGDLTGAFRQLDQSVAELAEQERFNKMRKLKFFRNFSYPEIWELMNASQWCDYVPGERIVTEGEMEDCFLIFVSGEVAVRQGGRLIRVLRRDDCFGEMAYLNGVRRTVTLEVVAPTAIVRVNAGLMERASMPCQLKFTQQFLYTLLERLGAH